MIPSILLLILLGFWLSTAYKSRFQSPEHLETYRSVLILTLVILTLLYWGDFFDVLIAKLK